MFVRLRFLLIVTLLIPMGYALAGEKETSPESIAIKLQKLENRCTASESDACEKLGTLFSRGKEVPKDPDKEAHYRAKACELGNAMSCWLSGNNYLLGLGRKKNLELANKFYAKGCNLEAFFSLNNCEKLADSYILARGVSENYKISAKLLTRVCDTEGNGASGRVACSKLAKLYQKGLGVGRSFPRSIAYREKACGFKYMPSCAVLADDYHLGYATGSRGNYKIGKNLEKARRYGGKACGVGLSNACHRVALTHYPQNIGEYSIYLIEGCEKGAKQSCYQLGRDLDFGKIPKGLEYSSIASYMRQACRLGEKRGCGYKDQRTLAREARVRRERELALARQKEIERKRNAAEARRRQAERRRARARGECEFSDLQCHLAVLFSLADSGGSSSSLGSSGPSGSSGSSSSKRSNSRNGKSRSSRKNGGFKITETIKYTQGQKVVARGRCSDGTSFNVRFYPNNGRSSRFYIYSTSGDSVSAVAKKFCRNH